MSRLGVLVMAYGGPDSLDDVEPYLRDVRGGRETPDHVLEEVRGRYAAIGGRSPLREKTERQAAALRDALRAAGSDVEVVVGMRHWQPRIDTALRELVRAGIDRAVGLVMAPHYSRMSIGAYREVVDAAQQPVEVAMIESWHLLPEMVALVGDRIQAALDRVPGASRDKTALLFTAHSLPARILSWDDPYPKEFAASVEAVMSRIGSRPYRLAYQSAGARNEKWLDPDAGSVLTELASGGIEHVIVAPIGFVSDHVEVLYDIDIELESRARELGVGLDRIEMPNDDPGLAAGLARLVRATAAERGWT